jgi:hypothetical protein
MAIDKNNQKAVDEAAVYIQDTLLGVAGNIGVAVKDAIQNSFEQVDSSGLKEIGRDLTKSFRDLSRFTDDSANNSIRLKKGLLLSSEVSKQLEKLEMKRAILARKIMLARTRGVEINQEDMQNSKAALDSERDALKAQIDKTKDIESKIGGLPEIFDRLSKNKFFGSLINAKEASAAMKVSINEGDSAMRAFGKGAQAAFENIERSTIILAIASALKKVFDTFVSLAVRADELTVSVAKNLGVSQQNADKLLESMQRTNEVLSSTSYISEDLIKAQQELVGLQGALTLGTEKQIEGQAFLTKFVGLQGENAAFVNAMLANQGKNAKEVFDNINATAAEQAKQNGFTITASEIMREIGDSSADILANFGFNTDEIANAVIQTRRFGVSLTQAKNIAGGLLDFETSIGAELEAEILLGRQFNFERARALAATGDIAGATAEVLAQTQSLTDEQLRSPIIQDKIASATGQSVEELFKARELSKSLNMSQTRYNDLLRKGGKLGMANAVESLALEGATAEQIEQNLTAQEKFNNAITNAKDQFADLVGSGAIQGLTAMLPGLLRFIGIFSGTRYQQNDIEELEATIREKGLKLKKEENEIQEEVNKARDEYYDQQARLRQNDASKGTKRAAGNYQIKQLSNQAFDVNDFTIRSNPKDTLVMAGGTKFGDETNKLLKSMLGELKKSSVLNIDSNGVMQKFVETNYK